MGIACASPKPVKATLAKSATAKNLFMSILQFHRLKSMMIPAIGPSCWVGVNWVVHAGSLVHALTHL
jgi:hypothetical protein